MALDVLDVRAYLLCETVLSDTICYAMLLKFKHLIKTRAVIGYRLYLIDYQVFKWKSEAFQTAKFHKKRG